MNRQPKCQYSKSIDTTFSWNRQRSKEELTSFISAKLKQLDAVEL